MTEPVPGPVTEPELPERLATERLRLILVTLADAADMRDGRHQDRWHRDYPRQDDRDAATMIHEPSSWGPRHLVHDGLAVGSIGFFGPPEDGEVEVGGDQARELRGWLRRHLKHREGTSGRSPPRHRRRARTRSRRRRPP